MMKDDVGYARAVEEDLPGHAVLAPRKMEDARNAAVVVRLRVLRRHHRVQHQTLPRLHPEETGIVRGTVGEDPTMSPMDIVTVGEDPTMNPVETGVVGGDPKRAK